MQGVNDLTKGFHMANTSRSTPASRRASPPVGPEYSYHLKCLIFFRLRPDSSARPVRFCRFILGGYFPCGQPSTL